MTSISIPYGVLADGTRIDKINLVANGLSMNVLTWGAVIQDLKVSVGNIRNRRAVLGLNSLEDYTAHSPYFGAIAGRCANRVAHGRFKLDEKTYQLTQNEPSGHHLHGGVTGLSNRPWSVIDASSSHVTLEVLSPDGDEGYPGILRTQCTYRLLKSATLSVQLTAETTAPTLVNLAQHTYFNLDENDDIRSHKLWINAKSYLPTDKFHIPSGDIVSVADTAFDFRVPRKIGKHSGHIKPSYDHNFVLNKHKRAQPLHIATLTGTKSLAMDIMSDQSGLQFYDGSRLEVPAAGLAGKQYGPYSGLCLEPQIWPDAQNHSHFPSAVLRPNQKYIQNSSYQFYETA
jgi:aldose 1-epimerase